MYRVIVAGNFGPDLRRIEVGDILTDLTKAAAKDLLNAGMIEPVEATTKGVSDGPDVP